MTFLKLTLPVLAYAPTDLEPVLSGEIVELHHKKHHQTYVNNYNAALDQIAAAYAASDLLTVQSLLPVMHFNLGGYNTHVLYWENLAPVGRGGGEYPADSALAKAIAAEWGSLEAFITTFNAKTVALQGSGWGWLAFDPHTKLLSIETTPNQDLIKNNGRTPLLGIDVWEHAYYLQYKNARAEYLAQIWKIVNWRVVAQRLDEAVTRAA